MECKITGHGGTVTMCAYCEIECRKELDRLRSEVIATHRENDGLRQAAELGAKNIRIWLQEECGCESDGHVCGIRNVQRDLETIEKAIMGKREGLPKKSQSYPGQAVCDKCKQCWCVCA